MEFYTRPAFLNPVLFTITWNRVIRESNFFNPTQPNAPTSDLTQQTRLKVKPSEPQTNTTHNP